MTKNHIPFGWACWVAVLLNVSILVLAGWFIWTVLFEANPPAVVTVTTDQDIYSVGDELILTIDACRFTTASTTIITQYQNGLLHAMPSINTPSGPLGCRIQRVSRIVPALTSDEYVIHGTVIYHIHPWANRDVEWTTNTFTILDPESKP